MSTKDWKLDTNAYIMRMVDEAALDGSLERRAKMLGCSYHDAAISLCEELERPFKASEEKLRKQRSRQRVELSDEEIDRRAQSYAAKNGVSYSVALDAVIGPTPGAQSRSVELAEAPLRVDDADEKLNRRVEDRARRTGCTYEDALAIELEER